MSHFAPVSIVSYAPASARSDRGAFAWAQSLLFASFMIYTFIGTNPLADSGAGSRADGRTIDEIADEATDSGDTVDVWVNMLVRRHALVSVRGGTLLQAGDEVLVSVDERWHPRLEDLFRAWSDPQG